MGFPGVVDRQNEAGYRSIMVPGAIRGLFRALECLERLGLDTVLGPAVQLAERGLPVDWFTTLQVALAMADPQHQGPAQEYHHQSLGKNGQFLGGLVSAHRQGCGGTVPVG
jgi:gamma-glutamyltranspeptidase